MLSACLLESVYYRHFGLSGAPFQFTPSPKLLFMSKAHRETLAALEWGLLHEPSGFMLLIGETGTGKTTLIVSLLAQNYAHLRVAYVSNPKLGFDGLSRDIARQFGISPAPDRLAMSDAFDRYLAALPEGERAVVIVDEAQALTDEILDELRLLSNRDGGSEKRLHFIFVGQPSLLTRLQAPALRQVNGRIGVRALLNPLDAAEARGYVDYRLRAFGGSIETVFGRDAVEYLLARCDGNPRRINVLCHNALLQAHNANEAVVSRETAHAAARNIDNLFASARHYEPVDRIPAFFRRRFPALASMTHGLGPAIAASMLAIVGIGSLYFMNSGALRPEEPVSIDAARTVGDAVTEYPGVTKPQSISAGDRAAASGAGEAPDRDGREPRRVRVQWGDTLHTIARNYLGSDDEVSRLIKANPQVGNVDHIYPGEMLNLPVADGEEGARATTPHERETSASDWRRVPTASDGLQSDEE
jgi:type II secretory pathway predicted ATPase ExeA/LysM repeat protein